jgi:hypothetical protein
VGVHTRDITAKGVTATVVRAATATRSAGVSSTPPAPAWTTRLTRARFFPARLGGPAATGRGAVEGSYRLSHGGPRG